MTNRIIMQSEQDLITLLTTVPNLTETDAIWRGLPFTITRDGHERRVFIDSDVTVSGELIFDNRLHTALEVARDIVYLAGVVATGADR